MTYCQGLFQSTGIESPSKKEILKGGEEDDYKLQLMQIVMAVQLYIIQHTNTLDTQDSVQINLMDPLVGINKWIVSTSFTNKVIDWIGEDGLVVEDLGHGKISVSLTP